VDAARHAVARHRSDDQPHIRQAVAVGAQLAQRVLTRGNQANGLFHREVGVAISALEYVLGAAQAPDVALLLADRGQHDGAALLGGNRNRVSHGGLAAPVTFTATLTPLRRDLAYPAEHGLLQGYPIPFLKRPLVRRLATQLGDAASDLVAENVGSTPHTGLLVHVTATNASGFHPQQASVGGCPAWGIPSSRKS
jgi:hypothetical protein